MGFYFLEVDKVIDFDAFPIQLLDRLELILSSNLLILLANIKNLQNFYNKRGYRVKLLQVLLYLYLANSI